MRPPPVLVVDDDAVSRAHIVELLSTTTECHSVASGAQALSWLTNNEPSLVVLDLLMSDPDGYQVLAFVRSLAKFETLPVVMVTSSRSEEAIENVFAAGADDYVTKPFSGVELRARVKSLLRSREDLARIRARESAQHTVLRLSQVLARSGDLHRALSTVVSETARLLGVDRASVVLFAEGQAGQVVASSDDPQLEELRIDLRQYPELRQVLETCLPLVIDDTRKHPLLTPVRARGRELPFRSSVLLPVLFDGEVLGILFLRSRELMSPESYELSLAGIIANSMAIALRNARMVESLRDATQRSWNARAEAEQRVQLFQRYADFFESSADGIIVVSRSGKVLFTNPRAREITGFSESRLVSMTLSDLFAADEDQRALRLIKGFHSGVYPRAVDVIINTQAAGATIVNASFSSVTHENNAVLMSFRDVTQERRTAVELKQTKEFLERVIDSSVDAIVSADLNGTVLLFNRAAERIFQYAASQVVGNMRVESLYPKGVARHIMRLIRDPKHGGYGRLEDQRVDMVNASGEIVPVLLSASLVIENEAPIGSVGIFTDIRERLKMEESLRRAEEELRSREKHAIVAELAGAAAHELNQPLTSVLGYAELLRRQLADDKLAHSAGVIIAEAERMAEIVRKVGSITRYETKSYVGSAKIVDLEKASHGSTDDGS